MHNICIFVVSVVPLIGDSLGILMQRQPKELDDILPGCFHRVRATHCIVTDVKLKCSYLLNYILCVTDALVICTHHHIMHALCVCLCLCVCLSSPLAVIPSSAFSAAWTRPLTTLLASVGHNGVPPMPSPTSPTPLISN